MQSFEPQHFALTVRLELQDSDVSFKQIQMQAQSGNTAFWTALHLKQLV